MSRLLSSSHIWTALKTKNASNRCILAEMATKQVFIMGKSNAHQLLRIFHIVGYPSADWSRFDTCLQYNDLVEDDPSSKRKKISVQEIIATARGSDNIDKHAFTRYVSEGFFSKSAYKGLTNDATTLSAFAGLDRALADLVRRLLNLDPAKRPSASEARNDAFFNAPPIVIPRECVYLSSCPIGAWADMSYSIVVFRNSCKMPEKALLQPRKASPANTNATAPSTPSPSKMPPLPPTPACPAPQLLARTATNLSSQHKL